MELMVSVITWPVYGLVKPPLRFDEGGRLCPKPGLDRLEKRKISCACQESNYDSIVA
jgi:hypothetical protein